MGISKSLNTRMPKLDMGIRMVCEFLPPKFKKQLLEIASIDDLVAAGYTRASAYKARELGVISDERCEKLVQVLGNAAKPILEEALNEFAAQLNKLGITTTVSSSSLIDCSKIDSKLDEIIQLLSSKKSNKTTRDLDRVYEEMKDSLGYVRIDDLRRELGMSLEEFMSNFREYILQNYELIQGGKEGFIRNGIIYGIIRKKKNK